MKGLLLITLVATLVRFLLRHLLAFVIICAVLLAGHWGWAQWQGYRASQAELAELAAADERIANDLARLATASQGRVAELGSASLDVLANTSTRWTSKRGTSSCSASRPAPWARCCTASPSWRTSSTACDWMPRFFC